MPDTQKTHVKAHISMHRDMKDALTILAELEGMTLSELLTSLGRAELKARGFKPIADGEKIAEELEKRRKSGSASV
jgi:hypothetical protein